MNIDGLTYSLLTKELQETCEGCQIQRITQPDPLTMVLGLYGAKGSPSLVITVGQRPALYITDCLQDLPKEPTGLVMFLRKQLEGGRITKIEQIHDDRIFHFTIDKLSLAGQLETKDLYVEVMGKCSNAILVSDGKILESLVHVTPYMSTERQVAPKLSYTLPPNAHRLCIGDFSKETLAEIIQQYQEEALGKTIRKLFNGFGNTLLDEVIYRMQMETEIESEAVTSLVNWTSTNFICLANILLTLYQEVKDSRSVYQYLDAKGKSVYVPIPLQQPLALQKTYPSLSPLLEAEANEQGSIKTASNRLKTVLAQAIKKESNRYRAITSELAEAKEADTYKLYADLLMIYAYLPHQYEDTITVQNYLSDEQGMITIPLRNTLTISENAQRYYKLYHKLKKRVAHATEQLEGSQAKSAYLASILYGLEQEQDPTFVEEIQRECEALGLVQAPKKNLQRKNQESSILTIPIEGGRILIGRNNKQNEAITHRMAKPDDYWFHTLQIPGSHVVLQVNYTPDEHLLLEVARYAAYFSQARTGSKVPVDIVKVKDITKPKGTPPGFVIYKNQRTLYVDPESPNL